MRRTAFGVKRLYTLGMAPDVSASRSAAAPRRRAQAGRKGSEAPTPRERLTVDRIVEAALSIIDVEGTSAVTMRRVAGDLGVSASSLYEHVVNRDELLGLAADEVSRQIGLTELTGDWQCDLKAHFLRAHAVYESHGDIAFLHFGTVPSRPQQLHAVERMLTALDEGGVPEEVAVFGLERLSLYTVADAYEGWEFARRHQSWDAEGTQGVRDHFAELSGQEFPLTRRQAHILTSVAPGALFEVGLDLLIAGMAARIPGSGQRDGAGLTA